MKKIAFSLSFLLISLISNAQITFQRTYGGDSSDVCYAIMPTGDGGYVLAGGTKSFGQGDYDIYIIKTDDNGDTLWTKVYGGILADMAYDIKQTFDSGFVIVGYTQSFGAGLSDVLLIKTDANGDALWSKTYGGSSSWDGGYSIEQTSDSGYIIAGYTAGQMYLIKTTTTGDTIWTKSYYWTVPNGDARCIKQITDGYIITGRFSNSLYLFRTDLNGNVLWLTVTSPISYPSGGNSVLQTAGGGFIAAGYSQQSTIYFGPYVVKTDTAGNVQWSRQYPTGDFQQWYYGSYTIAETADNGYIMAGNGTKLTKLDSAGIVEWSRTYGAANAYDIIYHIQQTNDGGYILGGITTGFGAGMDDFYLIKTDSSGNSGCFENTFINNSSVSTLLFTNPAMTTTNTPSIIASANIFISSGSESDILCYVGIEEVENKNSLIEIYPNPTTSTIIISSERIIKDGILQLINILGEIVLEKAIHNVARKEIQIENIQQGVYFAKVYDGEIYLCKKIIVE